MPSRSITDNTIALIKSFEGGVPRGNTDDGFCACSMCFSDSGLQLDASLLGMESPEICPNCSRVDGRKLSIGRLDMLARRYFVWGSLVRQEFGAAPRVQFNSLQKTSIAVSKWLEEDLHLFEKLLCVGFFHYGPRYWMVGEVEPLKALRSSESRQIIIDRIMKEYPSRSMEVGRKFFRLRKFPERPNDPNEYDTPPIHLVGSGRLDSHDCPVLYGSSDLQVCLHECRVSADDEIYAAVLQPTRELHLLDLSALLHEPAGVTEFESLDMAVHMLFLAASHSYEITRAIALRARDLGYDGLIYPSYFSLLRTGAMPFETAYGISARRMADQKDHEQSKAVPNLAIFGHPVKSGTVSVSCIDKVILNRVVYGVHFGPASID